MRHLLHSLAFATFCPSLILMAQPAGQGQPVPPYAARWAPQAQQIFLSYWTARGELGHADRDPQQRALE